MARKKTKGVIEKIGDAVATSAEAVIDAGSKAIHAVGDMMPTGKTPPKKAVQAKSRKSSAPKPKAKASQAHAKAAVAKVKPKAAVAPAKGGGTTKKKAAKKSAAKAVNRPKVAKKG